MIISSPGVGLRPYSQGFRLRLALLFECEIFDKHAYVFRRGDLASALYFLGVGTLEVVHGRQSLGSLYEGSFFGIIDCFLKVARRASIRAAIRSFVFSISFFSFMELLQEFPSDYAQFLAVKGSVVQLNDYFIPSLQASSTLNIKSDKALLSRHITTVFQSDHVREKSDVDQQPFRKWLANFRALSAQSITLELLTMNKNELIEVSKCLATLQSNLSDAIQQNLASKV